jgi:hypothetical protein
MLLIYGKLASLQALEALMSVFAQELIGLGVSLVKVKDAVTLDVNQ